MSSFCPAGSKNVVELSKIYSQLRPLCKFDTPADWFRERIARVTFVCSWLRNFSKIKNEWKWQYADKASSLKREKTEPRASDNCRMCCCCFKTQFGNFKSGWISSENMFDFFLPLLEKGETTLPLLADFLINELCVVLDDGESFSTRVFSPRGTRCFATENANG